MDGQLFLLFFRSLSLAQQRSMFAAYLSMVEGYLYGQGIMDKTCWDEAESLLSIIKKEMDSKVSS